jgi:hypothetical protein
VEGEGEEAAPHAGVMGTEEDPPHGVEGEGEEDMDISLKDMEILDEEDVDALVGIHETSPPTTDLVPASPANADIRALEEHMTPLVETTC